MRRLGAGYHKPGGPALETSAGPRVVELISEAVLARQHDYRWGLSNGVRCQRRGVEDRGRNLARAHAAGTDGRRSARGRAGSAVGALLPALSAGAARCAGAGTTGTTRAHAVRVHPRRVVLVVVVMAAVVPQRHSGEEDDGDDEHDAGDDGYPRRGEKDPRGPV